MKRVFLICLFTAALCACGKKTLIGVDFPEPPVEIACNEDFGMGLINYFNILQTPNGTYRMYFSGNESSGAEIFVFGTLNFTSDAYISAYGTNDSNVEFTRSCVRDLLNSTGNPTLGIATKTVDNFNIDTAKATTTSSTLVLIIFMMVIPILMIGVAVVVYTKRKNL